MTHAGRRSAAALLTLLASVMILVTLVTSYINHQFASSSNFADRGVSVLRSDSVDQLIVTRVTDEVVPNSSYAAGVRPVIKTAVHYIVSSRLVTAEFRAAAENLQTQLADGNADQLTLELPNVGSALASRVGSASPELADELRGIGTVKIVDVHIPSGVAKVVHGTISFSKNAALLLILTLALILLALVVTPERRRALMRIGLGALVSGLLVIVLYLLGRVMVAQQFSGEDAQTAARAVWGGYLGGIELPALLVAGGGLVVTVAAAAL